MQALHELIYVRPVFLN